MKKPAKAVLWTLVGVFLLILIFGTWFFGPFAWRVQRFGANPNAGFHSEFFLYLSPGAQVNAARGRSVTLLVQPNNSGTNSDNQEVHSRDAWWTTFGRHGLADELEVALLVPAFPRPGKDWHIYTHALDLDTLKTDRQDLARLDLQLIAMVDQARETLEGRGVTTDSQFLIQGFSASGMFANRFALLHPHRVKAVSAGSPGGWPIAPISEWEGEKLPYPIGVENLESLTGKPFDLACYRTVPQLLVMGSLDENDSLDFRDGWDEGPAGLVDRLFGNTPLQRWKHAEEIYRRAGAEAKFLLVEGVGHDRKKLQTHTTRFFKEILARDSEAK